MSLILPPTDSVTGAIQTIDWEHSRIHNSKGYLANGKYTVANTATHYFLMSVAAATYPHLRALNISATAAPLDVYLYESPTTSANGTAITVKNYNRNSASVGNILCYDGPTVSVDGTELEYFLIPGAKQTGGSGEDGIQIEWILKPSTNYLIKVVNNSGASSDFALKLFWYENG